MANLIHTSSCKYLSIVNFCLVLLFASNVLADCKSLKLTTVPYDYSAPGQNQRVSAAVHCPKNGPKSVYDCRGRGFDQPGGLGCQVAPTGYIHATGFTNLSLPAHDTDYLYALAGKMVNKIVHELEQHPNKPLNLSHRDHDGPRTLRLFSSTEGFTKSVEGCVNYAGSFYNYCIEPGKTKYIDYAPVLVCAEGILSDCGDASPIKNETPVQICGAVPQHPGKSDSAPLSAFGANAVTVAEAKKMTTHHAATKTCPKTHSNVASSFSSGNLGFGSSLISALVVALIGMSIL